MAFRGSILVFAACLSSVACGGSDPGTADNNNPVDGPQGPAVDPNKYTAGAADPCTGHAKSGYLNDELCLAPPPPGVGFQIHFGPPEGSDYTDPDVLAPYILPAGKEGVLCESAITPNDKDAYSQEQHVRARSGTHHVIFWRGVQADLPDVPDQTLQPDNCRQGGYTFFMGEEAGLTVKGATLDVPLPGATSAYGPEDTGVAQIIKAHTKIWTETHYVNTTDKDELREVWANVIYVNPSKITTIMDPIFWIGGVAMNVLPKTEQVVQGGPAVQPATDGEHPVRLMGIAGHVHAHTTRESVFLNHKDTGQKELIYETFNWSEPLFAQFDTQHTNPALGADGADGAKSGNLILNPGDTVTWECDVNNTSDAALHFADLAYTAEMCNVFGYYVPGSGAEWAAVSP